jgi:hypothetical protein
MNDYYNANQIPCRFVTTSESTPRHLFVREAIRSNLTTLPPNPFIVPAVIEALSRTERYKSTVEVVPEEADLYCARYLKQNGGVVFTGDSDLLVHDLGEKGYVSFFKDIEGLPASEALRSVVYHPAAIADRLALPKAHGLRAIAFELVKDSHGTFRKLLAQAIALKSIQTYEGEYSSFSKEYIPLPPNLENGEYFKFAQALRELDPRISEYVLQFPSLAKLAGRQLSTAEVLDSPHVFLPFLLDCPVRTTAWEMSTSLRELAYGLLKFIVPKTEQNFSVFEHRREQTGHGKGWQLSSLMDIPKACQTVTDTMDQIAIQLPALSISDRWISFVIYQEIEWSTSAGRPVLSNSVSQQLMKLETQANKSYNWDTIQFLAQVQGTLYSLRMLQQITSLVISHFRSSTFPNEISALHKLLASVPQLDGIPDLESARSLAHKITAEGIVQAAYKFLGMEGEESLEPEEFSKSARKKRKKDKGKASSTVGRSSNLFQLLRSE